MCVLDVMDECVLDVMPCRTLYVCQIRNDSYLMTRTTSIDRYSSDLKVKSDGVAFVVVSLVVQLRNTSDNYAPTERGATRR